MNSLLRIIKKILFVLTACLSGLCLFIILTTFNINTTALNSDFHMQLFKKHDIYTKTHTVINSSINQYIDSFKKASPKDFEQHKEIFVLFQKSITPEMVKANLNSVRDGLFQYFKGERKFLPDINLNTSNQKKSSTDNSTSVTDNANKNAPFQALSKIEKVNLSAILLYINRSDISDSLFEIKFIYYAFSQAPGVFILVLFLSALIGLYLCGKFVSAAKWLAVFTLTGGITTILGGIGSFFYAYSVMPKTIYPLAISLPLESDVIISYLRDCITPLATSLSILGIFLLILSAVVFYLPILFPILFSKKQPSTSDAVVSNRSYKIIKNTIFTFFCLLLLSALIFRTNSIKADFEANDFSMAITKMKNANTVTEVISAQNEGIYTLNIKLVDKKNNTPVTNTKINVYGKSVVQDRYLNENVTTDDTGTAKFTLDKGAFRISFDTDSFPKQYQMPAAFFCDLKSAGTTIITVNLDEPEKTEQQVWGIAEIEILDKDNKPVQDIELAVDGIVSAPGFPNEIFSITNSEGIAVFKISPGVYKINFIGDKFTKQYAMPIPIDVNITADSVTRYTIRLVDLNKEQKR